MKRNLLIVMVAGGLLVITAFATNIYLKRQNDLTPTGSIDTDVATVQSVSFYPTQAECEATSGKDCEQVMCDYIPEGKTIDEVCGKGYKKGYWSAITR